MCIYRCGAMLLIILGRYPEGEELVQVECLTLVLLEIVTFISIVLTPVYVPTNSREVFLFTHSLGY